MNTLAARVWIVYNQAARCKPATNGTFVMMEWADKTLPLLYPNYKLPDSVMKEIELTLEEFERRLHLILFPYPRKDPRLSTEEWSP